MKWIEVEAFEGRGGRSGWRARELGGDALYPGDIPEVALEQLAEGLGMETVGIKAHIEGSLHTYLAHGIRVGEWDKLEDCETNPIKVDARLSEHGESVHIIYAQAAVYRDGKYVGVMELAEPLRIPISAFQWVLKEVVDAE